MQAVDRLLFVNVPTAHGEHAPAREFEYVPGWHELHSGATVSLKVPASQLKQSVEARRLYSPALHQTQSDEPVLPV